MFREERQQALPPPFESACVDRKEEQMLEARTACMMDALAALNVTPRDEVIDHPLNRRMLPSKVSPRLEKALNDLSERCEEKHMDLPCNSFLLQGKQEARYGKEEEPLVLEILQPWKAGKETRTLPRRSFPRYLGYVVFLLIAVWFATSALDNQLLAPHVLNCQPPTLLVQGNVALLLYLYWVPDQAPMSAMTIDEIRARYRD